MPSHYLPIWDALLGIETFRQLASSFCMAIPIKCFVSHRPVSCDGGSVGRAKKKKEHLKGSFGLVMGYHFVGFNVLKLKRENIFEYVHFFRSPHFSHYFQRDGFFEA